MIRKFGFFSVTAFLFLIVILTVECKKNDEPTLPVLTTIEPSNITDTTAISGGKIASDGGAKLTSRGICWDVNPNPEASGRRYTKIPDTGTFVIEITGLKIGTKYHVRAFAENSVGIAYGEDFSFTTGATLPDIVTTEASALSAATAVCGGNITGNEGTQIISCGVCWSKSQNPTISDNKTTKGLGAGSFTANIFGLASNTTYYVRAYATNLAGTSYGNEVSFKTHSVPSGKVADADGNLYDMITIGNQIWMKQNLKTTHFPDGTDIQLVTGKSTWSGMPITDKSYSWYNYDVNNKEIYGALYTWIAAMNGAGSSTSKPSGIQGVCPTGWHLPSEEEWIELTEYLGGESVAGGKIKESDTIYWKNPNVGATNESSFTALGAGYRDGYDGSFYGIRYMAYWWSTTDTLSNYAKVRLIYGNQRFVQRLSNKKNFGCSVRCVKD